MAPLTDTLLVTQISNAENFYCRPWSELFLTIDNDKDEGNGKGNGNGNSGAFSKPESLADATSRVRRNAEYFCGNYVTIVLAAVFLTLLGHPLSLLMLLLVAAPSCVLLLLRGGRLVVGNDSIEDDAVLAVLVVTTIAALLLSDAAATVAASIAAGCGASMAHAAFRVPIW